MCTIWKYSRCIARFCEYFSNCSQRHFSCCLSFPFGSFFYLFLGFPHFFLDSFHSVSVPCVCLFVLKKKFSIWTCTVCDLLFKMQFAKDSLRKIFEMWFRNALLTDFPCKMPNHIAYTFILKWAKHEVFLYSKLFFCLSLYAKVCNRVKRYRGAEWAES